MRSSQLFRGLALLSLLCLPKLAIANHAIGFDGTTLAIVFAILLGLAALSIANLVLIFSNLKKRKPGIRAFNLCVSLLQAVALIYLFREAPGIAFTGLFIVLLQGMLIYKSMNKTIA